jgi:predicted house-cleaning noncanonical NTP pyrophosphatase (MazG superfamily)
MEAEFPEFMKRYKRETLSPHLDFVNSMINKLEVDRANYVALRLWKQIRLDITSDEV